LTIVNDVTPVVWQKAGSFDGSCKVSIWIFAIAYRKACMSLHEHDESLDHVADTAQGEEGGQPERRFELRCLD